MRIAIMAPLVTAIREPQLGGSQAFVSDLARGLTGRGHDVHVYAASGSEIPGVEVVDTGVDPAALAGTLFRAAGPSAGRPRDEDAAAAADEAFAAAYAALPPHRYDVVHNHAFDAPAVWLAATLETPVLHTLHLPPEPAMAMALREVSGRRGRPTVATVSEFQAKAWRELIPVDAVLPPYPRTAAIPWSDQAEGGLLFAGRLSPEKGAAEAIDIARACGMDIDLYGDVYDSDYARSEIDPRRDWPGVTVHAGVPHASLWEAMTRAAVVLCPSRWDEPFGLAAAEAQACGAPVVAFRRGGLSEVVADGETGFLVAPDDVPAAAAAATKAAGLSRTACRQHAERHLDLARSLDAHEHLYGRMVGG